MLKDTIKNKKGINLLSFLLKSVLIVFLTLIFIYSIVSISQIDYHDRGLLANITINNFIRGCLINNTYYNTDILRKGNCIKFPTKDIFLKVSIPNEGNFTFGNTSLGKEEIFCGTRGSIFCKKVVILGKNIKNKKAYLSKKKPFDFLNVLVIVTS